MFNRFHSTIRYTLALACLALAAMPVQADTVIRRVSFATRSDGQGMVIRLHTDQPISAYSEPRMSNEHALEIILFNAALAADYKLDNPFLPIRDVSVEERNGHLLFRFNIEDQVTVEAAAYPDNRTSDLLVGLSMLARHTEAVAADINTAGQPSSSARLGAAPEPSATPARSTNVNPSAANDTPIPVRPKSASMSGERWQLDTIVIDAGHGGHDPGASANGVREKDLNLAVALKLGRYLEELLHVNVVYTRTDDRFIELHERGKIANQAGAKLFISIHANAFPKKPQVRGTETYFLGMHKTDEARDVIERENSVVKLEDNQDHYVDFFQNSILRSLALSANMRMSEKLAAKVNQEFVERARRPSRGVKQAGFIVLWAASMPAILVEMGYVTNRFEAAYLNSEQGQDYLASAIYRAVRDYKAEYEKGLELATTR
ncbi:MAG: N-acetylmuramoyl-L-alanine amidase [Rhodothermales bacterium]